jgi:hypothetical protein
MWLLCWYTAEERAAEASISFRAAELRSLAVLCGVDPARLHIALGSSSQEDEQPGTAAAAAPGWVAEVMGGRSVDPNMVPVYFDTDLHTAVRIARRSVLLRALLEVWGTGVDLARCVEATQAAGGGGVPSSCAEVSPQSFRVSIAGIGCHLTREQQREAIDALLPVSGMRGPVRMKGAECVLWYIADRWEAQALAHRRRQGKVACIHAASSSSSSGGAGVPDAAAGGEEPGVKGGVDGFVVFGREVSCGSRDLIERLALSERRYLG